MTLLLISDYIMWNSAIKNPRMQGTVIPVTTCLLSKYRYFKSLQRTCQDTKIFFQRTENLFSNKMKKIALKKIAENSHISQYFRLITPQFFTCLCKEQEFLTLNLIIGKSLNRVGNASESFSMFLFSNDTFYYYFIFSLNHHKYH